MHKRLSSRHLRFAMLPAAAAVALALAACGGGGGGGSGPGGISLSGAAIDAPLPGAAITITSGAPLADGGTTIGTATANSQGSFTLSVTLPSGSVPIFANAAAVGRSAGSTPLELSSYLGQSDVLATVGTLSTINLPDLDISPVSTAALAVYAQTHAGSYSTLGPATYASTIATYRNDILAIAAAVKAVGDNYCTPQASVSSTTDLARLIASSATLSSSSSPSTTLATAAAVLGGTCAQALPALQVAILADPDFAPELDLGDVIDANVQSVVPGTYQLQALVAETPMNWNVNTGSGSVTTPGTPNPAEVLVDPSVTIDASGTVSSSDSMVSGTLVGNLLTLNLKDSAGRSYLVRAKIASLPSNLSSQQAYVIQGGGVNTGSQLLASFSAALAPAAAVPVWNGYTSHTSEDGGARCATGQYPLRFDLDGLSARGHSDSVGSLGACVTPSSNGWSMSLASFNAISGDDGEGHSFTMPLVDTLTQGTGTTPSTTITWSEAASPAAPFILEAPDLNLTVGNSATSTSTTYSGNAYYVMGTHAVVVSSSSGGNVVLNLQDNFMTQLSESSHNVGGDGSQQGDH